MGVIKFFKIVILSLSLLLLVFAVGIVLPEYWACNNATENEITYDIWGSEVYCGAENTEFSEFILYLMSLWLVGFGVVYAVLHWYHLKLKKKLSTP